MEHGKKENLPTGGRHSTSLRRPALIAAIALAAVAFAGAGYEFLRPLRVGLYATGPAEAEALASMERSGNGLGGARIALRALDQSRPLAGQLTGLGKPDLVISRQGLPLADAALRLEPVPDGLAGLLPASIRDAAAAGGKRYGLAIEADHFEVAFQSKAFALLGRKPPQDLGELEAGARALRGPKSWPVFVAGGNDEDLLLLVTALVASRGGGRAAERLETALAGADSIRGALDLVLADEGGSGELTLRKVLEGLGEWRKQGILHPEWYRMEGSDVAAFMERGMAPIVLMPLSRHRTIPHGTIQDYEGLPFPAARKDGTKPIVAPLTIAAAVSGSWRRTGAMSLIRTLLGPDAQKALCDPTGLAPAAASAGTLDLQSADARLWIAASDRALTDLGSAACRTGTARPALAKEIRLYIEAGGTGF